MNLDTQTHTHTHTHTAVNYVIQKDTEKCNAGSLLNTLEECKRAQRALDPGASEVEQISHKNAPTGCARHERDWFFNTHLAGKLDGYSQPVCKITKTTTGKT